MKKLVFTLIVLTWLAGQAVAQQTIDSTDSLRQWREKINANFTAVFNRAVALEAFKASRGQANGVAPLNAAKKVPAEFLPATGNGTVTSINLLAPNIFTVTGAPVSTSGTIELALAVQPAKKFWSGPTSGGDAAPTFRLIVPGDLPVMVGAGAGHAAGIVPDPGGTAHGWFLRDDGVFAAAPGTGTVTSVGATVPSFLTVGGVPITGSGSINIGLANQTASFGFFGPTSGGAAAPSFRQMVLADLNSIVVDVPHGGLGVGTVTGLLKGNGTSPVTAAVVGVDYITASGSDTLTNKTFNSEGTGNTLTTAEKISIDGAGCGVSASPNWDWPTSSAPTASCSGTTTQVGSLDFADGATSGATRHFRLPGDWTGAVDVALIWFANASSSNAVRWQVSCGCAADSEAISTGPSYNTASATNSAYTGTANQRKTTSFTSISTTNCAAGETFWIRVERVGGDAGDTLTATARLLEAEITLRRAQ